MKSARQGLALALVLAALVLAGALAAGAVMYATQSMRDAAGAVARLQAAAAAEQGLATVSAPTAWSPSWSLPGPPGPLATIAFSNAHAVDTVRVLRLSPTTYLLLSESRTLSPITLSAHSRLSLLVTIDSTHSPHPITNHSWADLP